MTNIRTATNRGAFDSLTKPIDFNDLETTLRKTLEEVEIASFIGDVSGKGTPAALFTAVSRTLLRSTVLQGASPADCLACMNRVLLRQNGGENSSRNAVCASYWLRSDRPRRMRWCARCWRRRNPSAGASRKPTR